MPVSVHEIDIRGLSGAIFWLILATLVFYVIGFATVGWENRNTDWVGLWQTCFTSDHAYKDDWFTATQAFMIIGLILLVGALITIFLYMFFQSVTLSKNKLLIAFVIIGFATAVFMLIGLIIFGANHRLGGLHWSYAFSVIGTILCFTACIVAVVHMKKSNVV